MGHNTIFHESNKTHPDKFQDSQFSCCSLSTENIILYNLLQIVWLCNLFMITHYSKSFYLNFKILNIHTHSMSCVFNINGNTPSCHVFLANTHGKPCCLWFWSIHIYHVYWPQCGNIILDTFNWHIEWSSTMWHNQIASSLLYYVWGYIIG